MAGNMLTVAAALTCPHGATVVIESANPGTTAGGAAIATADDSFTVVGCPFQLPTVPPTPSPCVTVQWLVTDLRVKANNAATLSESSLGICYSAMQVPHGPVVIQSAPPGVSTQ
jgi:hypothetical protein